MSGFGLHLTHIGSVLECQAIRAIDHYSLGDNILQPGGFLDSSFPR